MAKILEEGDYKFPDWSMEVRCMSTADWLGLRRKPKKPCYSKIELEDGDIVKRGNSETIYYGFICPKCKCFTELSEEEVKKIPENVKYYALQVACPGSDQWDKLSDEEKKLSENL